MKDAHDRGNEGEKVRDGIQASSTIIGVESTARTRLSGTLVSVGCRQFRGVDAKREWGMADDNPGIITRADCTHADGY